MISENEVQEFQKILGLKPTEQVPSEIIEAYEKYDYAVSVCSAGTITTKELILICLITGNCHSRGSGEVKEASSATYFDGEEVIVTFKKKKKNGVFLKLLSGDDEGKAWVKLEDDNAKYREIPITDITSAG